jgi:serine O-acetyltransferase
MTGIPARAALVDATEYQKGFVPYGTPCSELYDPQTQKVELMRCELERLRAQLDALLAERDTSKERDRA